MARDYNVEPFFDGRRDGETDAQAIRRLTLQLRARARALPAAKRRFVGCPLGDFDGVVTGIDPTTRRYATSWQSLPVVIRGEAGQFRFDYGTHKGADTVHWVPATSASTATETVF